MTPGMNEHSTELVTVHGEVLNPALVRSVRVESHAREGGPMSKEHRVKASFGWNPSGNSHDEVYLTPALKLDDANRVLERAVAILYGRPSGEPGWRPASASARAMTLQRRVDCAGEF